VKTIYRYSWKHSTNYEIEIVHLVHEKVVKDVSLISWKMGISKKAEADWSFEYGSSIRQDFLLNIYNS
jgi:hypothetical protein